MKCSDYGSKCLNLKRLGAKLAVFFTLSSLLCTSWKPLSHLLLGQTLVSRTKPGLSFQLKKWACIYTIQYMLINKTAQLIVEYLAKQLLGSLPLYFTLSASCYAQEFQYQQIIPLRNFRFVVEQHIFEHFSNIFEHFEHF